MDPNGIVAPERVLRREAQGLLEAAGRIDYDEFTRAVDLVAECRLLKLGKRFAVGEVTIRSDGVAEPVAHVTSTYSIPSK